MSGIDVSVIIPTYRREEQVVQAAVSALAERSLSIEVLIVDDTEEGSAAAAVQGIEDTRVSYLKCAEPSGGRPGLVRNFGAQRASGRYLHFLDDDDVLEPDALSVLAMHLDASPHAGMAFGVIVPFGEDESRLRSEQLYFRRAAAVARQIGSPLQMAAQLLFFPTILINSACMARRQVFLACGGYDDEMRVCEDVDLWRRVARASNFEFVDRPIVRYRTGAPSIMRSLGTDDERLENAWRRAHEKYLGCHGKSEFLALKLWARLWLRWFR